MFALDRDDLLCHAGHMTDSRDKFLYAMATTLCQQQETINFLKTVVGALSKAIGESPAISRAFAKHYETLKNSEDSQGLAADLQQLREGVRQLAETLGLD
jgi:hypothetical protein